MKFWLEHLVTLSWPVILDHRLQPLVSLSTKCPSSYEDREVSHPQGQHHARRFLLANTTLSWERAVAWKTHHFFEPFILRGSAKRSHLKNNLISLLDLDKQLILGTENERKWPNTENPHIEFQSPACKLESLTVTIQTCVLVVLESSGVELQRTEKGAEDIWEDNQRSEQKEGRQRKVLTSPPPAAIALAAASWKHTAFCHTLRLQKHRGNKTPLWVFSAFPHSRQPSKKIYNFISGLLRAKLRDRSTVSLPAFETFVTLQAYALWPVCLNIELFIW